VFGLAGLWPKAPRPRARDVGGGGDERGGRRRRDEGDDIDGPDANGGEE
jgi:hypothetical protein